MSQEARFDILERAFATDPGAFKRALLKVVERQVAARLRQTKEPGESRPNTGDALARLEKVAARLAVAVEALASERPKREIEIERLGNGMMIVREV